jgi:uncharacterized protein with HEPN domain
MYNEKNLLYIISALAASQKAMHYTQKFNTAISLFEADEQLHFNATLTLLMAIGEEAKKIDNELLQTQPSIEWQNLKDMRNFLAHDYRGVDEEIVFKVVKIELPKLSEAFIAFLHLFPKAEVEEALQNEYYKHLQKIIFDSE